MSSVTENLRLERASLKHKEGVKNISTNVYLGYDYLTSVYDDWVYMEDIKPDLRYFFLFVKGLFLI